MMREPVHGLFADITEKSASLSDHKKNSFIIKIAQVQEAGEMQQMDPEQMDRAIIRLRSKCVSVRRLSRLIGIPRGHVESVCRRKEQLA